MTGDGIMLWLFLGAAPIMVGVVAQKRKGRTGAGWWFLTLVVMLFFYFVTVGFGDDLVAQHGAVVAGLSGAILFGLAPMAVIVATLPVRRRKPEHGGGQPLT